jgi:hypothetical protein
MRGMRLDLVRRTVGVEAGATWGDLDHETRAYEPKVTSEAHAGSARDGGRDRYLVRPKAPANGTAVRDLRAMLGSRRSLAPIQATKHADLQVF